MVAVGGVAKSDRRVPPSVEEQMKTRIFLVALSCVLLIATAWKDDLAGTPDPGQTTVSIRREQFFINGKPTYEGRQWRGLRIEGLLMNSRMVQGIFDDLN